MYADVIFADMYISIEEISKAVGGDAVLRSSGRMISTLLTDSRAIVADPASSLFFALRTDVGDGHRYLAQLRDKGVRSFVVSDLPADMAGFQECDFIVTSSPWDALRKAGACARRRFQGTVVGVTGSRGKTTLKEYLFQALSPLMDVARSPRSFNSRLGVPLSLWRLPDGGHGVALIEAGISAPGEMEPLEEMIRPDIAVVTNIGSEHDGGFASRREKAREKLRLASHAAKVVFNADDPLLAEAWRTAAPQAEPFTISASDPSASVFVTEHKAENGQTEIRYVYGGEEHTATVPFDTRSGADNSLCALAVMLLLGLNPAECAARLAGLRAVDTRLDVAEGINGCKLIYDAFTSDLDSLDTALDFLKRRADGLTRRRTLILGDLDTGHGDESALYSHMAAMVRAAGVERLICIGPKLSARSGLFPEGTAFFSSTADFLKETTTSDFSGELIMLKGSPRFGFESIRTLLEARTHETVLEVNLDAIVRNFNYFRSHLPSSAGLVAMVKASGYGAGSVEIAKTLQEHGAAYLAVAVLDEGIELRRAGITMPIMVMNPKVLNYKAMFANWLEPEIYCAGMLEDVVREAAKSGIEDYPVHIKLDTGMHRMGFTEDELPALAARLRGCRQVRAASVFSHLATADCPDMDDYTLTQLERFARYTDYLRRESGVEFKRHILNSAGILRFPQYHYDMARLGIGLYGANTLPPEMEKPLDTVSTLRTVVIAVKERAKGETIGYARRGVLERDSVIATIPIGYADGMNRHFGNGHSKVWINGHLAPTVGNICMDACMIDVTGIPCKPGDAVEIFGPHIPVQQLADILDTIPYEVLTSVSPRVKRIYFRE